MNKNYYIFISINASKNKKRGKKVMDMYRQYNVNQQAMNQNDIMMITKDLIGELEAINQYGEHIMQTDNKTIINTLLSIRSEEQIHVGELLANLYLLEPEFKIQVEKGMKEFEE